MIKSPGLSFSLFAGVIVATVLSGCAHDPSSLRVMFSDTTINGRPTRLAMDTGAFANWIFSNEARRLDLISTPVAKDNQQTDTNRGLSEPVRTRVNGRIYEAPVWTIDLPWTARILWWIFRKQEIAGAIGWPSIRDNILIFDAERQEVRGVEKLPPATVDWLKVRVRRDTQLFLDLPFENGTTITFLVDTGDTGGVTLSSGLWEKWRITHPKTSIETEYGWFLGRTQVHRKEVVPATDVLLGSLALTRVPVGRQTAYEAGMKTHKGTFGILALERMDLIVDGKNGFAYLHAKLTTPLERSTRSIDWTVAKDLPLNIVPQLSFSAETAGLAKQANGDHAGAAADFARAVELDPSDTRMFVKLAIAKANAGDNDGTISIATRALGMHPESSALYATRGVAYLNKTEFDSALADFDRALAIDPSQAGAYLFRSIVRLNKGDFPGAIADADRALEFESVGEGVYVIRGMAKLSAGDFDGAFADLDRAVKDDSKNAELRAVRDRLEASKRVSNDQERLKVLQRLQDELRQKAGIIR